MTFLVTNDDGIESEGLIELVKWTKQLGDVLVVAPKVQQSGKSQGITMKASFEVKEAYFPIAGVQSYSVDSTPADCMRIALDYLGFKPDYVFSGINAGFNIGREILYSGTDGAVFETAFRGFKSVAWSGRKGDHGNVGRQLDRIWELITSKDLFSVHNLYNVNVPPVAGEIVFTSVGGSYRQENFINTDENMVRCKRVALESFGEGTANDLDAIAHNLITISPLSVDRTEQSVLARLLS